jgi:hypothetical protein
MCAANRRVNLRTRFGIVNFISFDFSDGVGNAIATVGYFLRRTTAGWCCSLMEIDRSIQRHNENLDQKFWEFIMSKELLTSDVVGLTKVAPFSRRGFMTASAAVTAGYTLATGPVRADVITTDTTGLTSGDAKIKVADGEMPGYFARPSGVANPPVVLVAMERFSDCTNTSRT